MMPSPRPPDIFAQVLAYQACLHDDQDHWVQSKITLNKKYSVMMMVMKILT